MSEAVVLCLSLFLRFVSSTSVDLAPSYLRSKHSFIPEATVALFPPPLSLSLSLSLFSHFLCADGGEGREGRERGAHGGGGASRKKRSFVLKPGNGRFVTDAGGAALLQYRTGG